MKKLISLHKKYKGSWGERGSMTVEMALIFPFILITILIVLYIVIIMYQFAQLQSLVNHTAEEAAAIWGKIHPKQDITSLMKTGQMQEDELKAPLYWRLLLLDDTAMKERRVAQYLEDRIQEKSILGLKQHEVTVTYKDYIIYKEITVSASVNYDIPIPLLKVMTGVSREYTSMVVAKSTVRDHAEFIRTIDFASDLMEDFEVTKTIKNKHGEILLWVKEKISDYFQKN